MSESISFNFEQGKVSGSRVKKLGERLVDYIAKVAEGQEKFPVHVPLNENIINSVEALVESQDVSNLKFIFVVGIGGSNLGTWAVYDAIRGNWGALTSQSPKILFVDTIAPELLMQMKQIIDEQVNEASEVMVNVISKSGGTAETISNFEIIYAHLSDKFGSGIKDRVVVTTDEGSKLWNAVEENGIAHLAISKQVGGRFSVMTAVGLYPLALAGIDIRMLVLGASDITDRCLDTDVSENYALASAAHIYHHNGDGRNIHNTFFFNLQLERVGKWYRQLMGESVGKKHSLDGELVYAGITPIISIGSTDLHSMAQLYYGGPDDKFTTLVYCDEFPEIQVVPKEGLFTDLVDGVADTESGSIMDAIYEGVKKAYENNELPYIEISMPKIDEYFVGQFLQLKMFEMIYLAKLMNVNAFNQPSVEDYKKEMRKILMSS